MRYKTQILTFLAVITLAIAIIFGYMWGYAYLSDRDDGINVVTIGNVKIHAYEPTFPTKDDDNDGVPDDCELVIPYEEINKDPKIKNTGKNDAVVFFKITAPAEMITAIDDNGKRQAEALTDLFWFKQKNDPDTFHQNNFNINWIELKTLDHKNVKEATCNLEGNGYTYIFGYHTRIREGEITANLFDKVQNKKYGSRTISANEVETIKVDAYAIQADDIQKAGIDIDTTAEISEENLTYIYNTFINQNKNQLK